MKTLPLRAFLRQCLFLCRNRHYYKPEDNFPLRCVLFLVSIREIQKLRVTTNMVAGFNAFMFSCTDCNKSSCPTMYAIPLSTENSGSIFGYSNNLLDFSIHFCDFQWQVNHRVKRITKSIGLSESVRKFLNGKNFVSFWMTLGSFRLMHRPQHDITLPSFRYLSHDRLFAIILWRTPLFMKHIY